MVAPYASQVASCIGVANFDSGDPTWPCLEIVR